MRRTHRLCPVASIGLVVLLAGLAGCFASAPLIRQAAALNSRGAAQLASDDLDGAEASFLLALEYNGRYAEPHNNLGLVALRRGRFREARQHFRAAIERNRDFGAAWSNLGIALSHVEGSDDTDARSEHAAAAFREALAVDPGLIEARTNLVRALLAMGRSEDALTHARRLTQLIERDPFAHTLRAEAALSLGLLAEAAAEIGVARRLAPRDPDVRLVNARVDMLLGARGIAREELRELLALPELAPEAHALLAAIALADGDPVTARRELAAGGPRIEQVPAARAVMAQLGNR